MCKCLLLDVWVRRQSLVSSESSLSIKCALCCPWSLRKMKSVYHGDWHCIVPSFNSCTHQTPARPSAEPLRHIHALIPTYTLQAQTTSDSVAKAASACSVCRVPFATVCIADFNVCAQSVYCHTSTLTVPHCCSGRQEGGGERKKENHTSVWQMHVAAMEALLGNNCIM